MLPDVVLIPGSMATGRAWCHQREWLERDRRVILPDVHLKEDSIVGMAQAIERVLPTQCDVVGWSMGGYIALDLITLAKYRIRRLVLICTHARADGPVERERRQRWLQGAETGDMRKLYSRAFDEGFVDKSSATGELRNLVLADIEDLGVETLRRQTRAMSTRPDRSAILGHIDVPVCIIAGEEDTVIPMDWSLDMAERLPLAVLHRVSGAGHFAPWERPQILNNLIADFLS